MVQDILTSIASTLPNAAHVKAKAGEILFRPDDPCRGFLALRSGTIKVALTAASGREIVLYRVTPGQICLQSFSCLLQDKPYAAEGIAEENVDALLIPTSSVKTLLAENAAFRDALLNSVAGRFSDFEQVVQTLAFTGLCARVAGALLRMSDAQGKVYATHEAIASEIGSAREAVSRQLGLFAKDNIVSLSRGVISVLHSTALSKLAAGPA